MEQAMDDIEQLMNIKKRLSDLQDNLLIAEKTKDKRRVTKIIRDAKTSIDNYASFLPPDVRATFEEKVGANALNFQHANDISMCIKVIENRINELRQQTNL